MKTVPLQPRGRGAERLDFEIWRSTFRSICGEYTLEQNTPNAFAGWLRPLSIHGLGALDVACRPNRINRTVRDARIDGKDFYDAVFQVAGRSTVVQNDQAVQLTKGDVVLVEKGRPAAYVVDSEWSHCLCIQFPRQALVSHLGFEPKGGTYKPAGTPAGRLLYELAVSALHGDDAPFTPADSYMQLAAYDLFGALFVPLSCHGPHSTDKLFARIESITRERFADPNFGPGELAADAGISLRYVHKLFAERGISCSNFIYSRRLERAAHLLQRKGSKALPLSEVAYACGFRDYTHFARRFKLQYGHSPSRLPIAS